MELCFCSRGKGIFLMLVISQLKRIQWGRIWETAALLLGPWGHRWAWNPLRTFLSAFPTRTGRREREKTYILNVKILFVFSSQHMGKCEPVPFLLHARVCVNILPLTQKQVCQWSQLRGVWSSQWWCWRLSPWWPSAWDYSPLFPRTMYKNFKEPLCQSGCKA